MYEQSHAMPNIRYLQRRSRVFRAKARDKRCMRRLRASGVQIGPESWVASGSQIRPGTVIGHHTMINGPASIRGAGRARSQPQAHR